MHDFPSKNDDFPAYLITIIDKAQNFLRNFTRLIVNNHDEILVTYVPNFKLQI